MSERSYVRRRVLLVVGLTVGSLAISMSTAMASLPVTTTPDLALSTTIKTRPFAGSTVTMKDNEDVAYVPRDNSIWLVDDNADSVYEVDAVTGALKLRLSRTDFESVPAFGGGPLAGPNRPGDLEALAYDEGNDILYAFSGSCCNSSALPTVFRLVRGTGGSLAIDSYQPLPTGSDFTAASWNSADGKIYVGKGRVFRPYDYLSNVPGTTFRVPNVTGILGMGFTPDGKDLFVVTNAEQLLRVNWSTRSVVTGWTFGLTSFGIGDSRGVALVGDQLYVSDGNDGRAKSDPLRYAVYVFNVLG